MLCKLVLFAAIGAPAAAANLLTVMPQQQNRAALMVKQDERGGETSAAVRAVLETQVAAWNRADINSFMEGYAKSPDTVFVSGDTVVRGWQTVLERYKKNYDSPDKMGTLAFSELEITPVSATAAIALGRWSLTRGGASPPFAGGRFTLVFRRLAGKWRIVHDHTSSAAPK